MAKRLAVLARAIALGTIVFAALGSSLVAKKDPPSRPIDLNVANVKELQELPGIGAVTAQAIIDFRKKSGPFHRVEDLLVIRGISPRKLDRMRPYLRIGSAPSAVKPAPKPATKPVPPVNKPPSNPATTNKPATSPSAPGKTSPATTSQATSPAKRAGTSAATQNKPAQNKNAASGAAAPSSSTPSSAPQAQTSH